MDNLKVINGVFKSHTEENGLVGFFKLFDCLLQKTNISKKQTKKSESNNAQVLAKYSHDINKIEKINLEELITNFKLLEDVSSKDINAIVEGLLEESKAENLNEDIFKAEGTAFNKLNYLLKPLKNLIDIKTKEPSPEINTLIEKTAKIIRSLIFNIGEYTFDEDVSKIRKFVSDFIINEYGQDFAKQLHEVSLGPFAPDLTIKQCPAANHLRSLCAYLSHNDKGFKVADSSLHTVLATSPVDHSHFHYAGFSKLDPKGLEDMKNFFGAKSHGVFVPEKTIKVQEMLEKNGWKAGNPILEIKFDFDNNSLNKPKRFRDDISLKKVNNYEEFAQWCSVVEKGYEGHGITKAHLEDFLKDSFNKSCPKTNKGCHFYLAYEPDNKQAKSAIMFFVDKDVADIHFFSTLPEEKGKGIGSAMRYKALTEANQKLGVKTLVSTSLTKANSISAKLGFVPVQYIIPYSKS